MFYSYRELTLLSYREEKGEKKEKRRKRGETGKVPVSGRRRTPSLPCTSKKVHVLPLTFPSLEGGAAGPPSPYYRNLT
jgi:hypothetical protein